MREQLKLCCPLAEAFLVPSLTLHKKKTRPEGQHRLRSRVLRMRSMEGGWLDIHFQPGPISDTTTEATTGLWINRAVPLPRHSDRAHP